MAADPVVAESLFSCSAERSEPRGRREHGTWQKRLRSPPRPRTMCRPRLGVRSTIGQPFHDNANSQLDKESTNMSSRRPRGAADRQESPADPLQETAGGSPALCCRGVALAAAHRAPRRVCLRFARSGGCAGSAREAGFPGERGRFCRAPCSRRPCASLLLVRARADRWLDAGAGRCRGRSARSGREQRERGAS